MTSGLVLILCLTSADANADAKRKNNKGGNVERSEKRKSARRRNKNRKLMNQKKKGSSKSKGKKKQNKKRKQKKSRNLKKGSSRSNCARQSAFCPSEKAQALNIYYNKMTNYFKQLKRAENWAKIVVKKKEKKDGFVNDALILEAAVGGDISAPVCNSRARLVVGNVAIYKYFANLDQPQPLGQL